MSWKDIGYKLYDLSRYNKIMNVVLPKPVVFILQTLKEAGFESYVVGGAVRDLLRKDQVELEYNFDFDFTTDARPEQIMELFPEAFYENNFGTVMIPHHDLIEQMSVSKQWQDHAKDFKPVVEKTQKSQRIIDLANATKVHASLQDEVSDSADDAVGVGTLEENYPNYEITTFRSDGAYSDHRRPDQVEWGKTLKEDLERRDFTINAMALEDENKLIDLHGGQDDLENGVIRTVGDPDRRFQEDALRMLRAVRFSVQLNMQIDEKTFESILENRDLIQHISWERIRDELLKMLKSNYPAEGIEILDEVGLLEYILPELVKSKGVEQGGHHTTDVWTHSVDALRECPSPDPVVRLATLLHDIAKPITFNRQNGNITFYNHEVVGARVAAKIAKRLRFSKKDVQRVFTLVRYHMFYYQPHNTDSSIRRFMRQVGLKNIDDILDLREGDRLGSGAKKTSWRLEEMKQRMIQQLHQPMDTTDLKINGHDLMTELNLQPGPVLGKILNHLLELVLEDPELNTREKLLVAAQQFIEKF
jgi:tRNA nucleotidyltransferase (CCA-adding enzyme)